MLRFLTNRTAGSTPERLARESVRLGEGQACGAVAVLGGTERIRRIREGQ